MLGNGIPDIECNNYLCQFDKGDIEFQVDSAICSSTHMKISYA